MTTANIIAILAVIIFLIILRDFWNFQRVYYSKRVRMRNASPRNRAEYRAVDKKARKAERTRRRVAQRRARK